MNNKFPFLYLGHGTGFYRKTMENYIFFKNELDEADKKLIEKQVPECLSIFFYWDYKTLLFGSDDNFPYYVCMNFGNVKESDLEKFESHYDEKLQTILYDEKVWKKFHSELDKCLQTIHNKFPIIYFNKGLDSEYRYELDEWHDWSSLNINTFFPHLEEFITYVENHYDEYKKKENKDNEIYTNVSWILADVLYYTDFDSDKIIEADLIKLLDFISITVDYDSYIGEYNLKQIPGLLSKIKNIEPYEYLDKNFTPENSLRIVSDEESIDFFKQKMNLYEFICKKIKLINIYDYNLFKNIGNLIRDFTIEEQIEVINNIKKSIVLSFFAASKENSDMLFNITQNVFDYIQSLILYSKDLSFNVIYRIAYYIANVEMKDTEGHTDVIIKKNKDSKPLLGAQIAELGFSLPKSDENIILFAAQIYNDQNMFEKGYECFERAVRLNIITPQIFTGLFYNGIKLGKQDDVEKFFEIFSKNEVMINNPNSLSNIIYMLNQKCEKGDKHANEMAIKLAKDYWEKKSPEDKVLVTLYINLSLSFISANSTDSIFESIINDVLYIFDKNPGYFSPYEGTMYGNIACYYAIINDKENAYKYLRKAKETKGKNFISFKLNKVFRSWQEDDEFKKIFSDYNREDVDESNPLDLFQKALELHENGKNDEAMVYYEKTLKINPKHEQTLLNIGNIYFDREEWDKVFEYYNKVIELSPNFLLGYTNRGEAYLLNDKYAEAVKDTTKAIELVSNYDYPFFVRGCAYYYLNDLDNAKKDFLKAVELNPEYKKTHGHNEWFSIIEKVLEL